MDIWIPVVVAIIGSVASFFGAIATSKSDLKKVKHQHELDLESLKEKHLLDMQALEKQQDHELKKINAELESQGKLYEKNKETDMIAGFMENPSMQGFLQEAVMQQLGLGTQTGPQNRQQNRQQNRRGRS